MPYSPLGRGFLTGRFRSLDDLAQDDWRRQNPRFQDEAFARNVALADRVKELATAKGCTPAQLALAWLLSRGPHIVPIPGSTRAGRIEENAAAVRVTITDREAADLDTIAAMAVGTRYPEAGMRAVNR